VKSASDHVDLQIALAFDRVQLLAEEEDIGSEDAKDTEGLAPADPCAKKAGDHQCPW
jgi:hypothetical protein